MVVLASGHQVPCILVQVAIFYKGINMQACSFNMFSNPCCTRSLVVSYKYWVVPLISTRISPDIHKKFLTWMTSWRPKRGCHSIHRDRQTSPDSTSMFGWKIGVRAVTNGGHSGKLSLSSICKAKNKMDNQNACDCREVRWDLHPNIEASMC